MCNSRSQLLRFHSNLETFCSIWDPPTNQEPGELHICAFGRQPWCILWHASIFSLCLISLSSGWLADTRWDPVESTRNKVNKQRRDDESEMFESMVTSWERTEISDQWSGTSQPPSSSTYSSSSSTILRGRPASSLVHENTAVIEPTTSWLGDISSHLLNRINSRKTKRLKLENVKYFP